MQQLSAKTEMSDLMNNNSKCQASAEHPQTCRLAPTIKHTGQQSGAELCQIVKFLESKRVNSLCKLLQLLADKVPQTHRRQSIGIHGVRTSPVFSRVVSTYMWTPQEFAFTV